ncbi:unnamed protein product, partial [Vitis vinifera]
MEPRTLHLLPLFTSLVSLLSLPLPSHSSNDDFVFMGCSQIKYTPNSPYESNLDSVLTSLANSATYSTYNNFTIMGYKGASSSTIMTHSWEWRTRLVGGSGDVQGVAQCVGDLSVGECQDCVSEAISRLKTDCGTAVYGDMFLGKCYARYTTAGAHTYAHPNHDSSHDDGEKTFAIIVGLLAGVALIIIFLTFMRKVFEGNGK